MNNEILGLLFLFCLFVIPFLLALLEDFNKDINYLEKEKENENA